MWRGGSCRQRAYAPRWHAGARFVEVAPAHRYVIAVWIRAAAIWVVVPVVQPWPGPAWTGAPLVDALPLIDDAALLINAGLPTRARAAARAASCRNRRRREQGEERQFHVTTRLLHAFLQLAQRAQ